MKSSVYELHGLLSKTKIVEVEVEVPSEGNVSLERPNYRNVYRS